MDVDSFMTNDNEGVAASMMMTSAGPIYPTGASSLGFMSGNSNFNPDGTSVSSPSMSIPNNNNNIIPILGMVASGFPMRTDFVPSDPSGTKFTMTLTSPGDLPSPLTLVDELTFFLLPSAASVLPPNTGLMIYWQLQILNSTPSSSGFELLGTLIPQTRPSQIFRTGWAEHDQFLTTLAPNQPAQIVIGISIEPLASVQNVEETHTISQQFRQQQVITTTAVMAQKIGQDLFNYMRSFDTSGATTASQTIVVPANIFDRWWQRFERKLQRDPNFFLKNPDNN
jgi:protein Hikeshi